MEGKLEREKATGRTRRTRINGLLQRTWKNKYYKVNRLAEDSETWRKETPTFLIEDGT